MIINWMFSIVKGLIMIFIKSWWYATNTMYAHDYHNVLRWKSLVVFACGVIVCLHFKSILTSDRPWVLEYIALITLRLKIRFWFLVKLTLLTILYFCDSINFARNKLWDLRFTLQELPMHLHFPLFTG